MTRPTPLTDAIRERERRNNGGRFTHRGRTIERVGDYKWIVNGWRGHAGYVSADAAVRAIDRIDRERND